MFDVFRVQLFLSLAWQSVQSSYDSQKYPSPNKENLACVVSYSKFDIILIFCFLILYAGCVLSSVILSSNLAWQILHVMCIIYIHKSVPPQTKTVSHVCYRVHSFLYIRFPFIAQMCDVHEVKLFLALLCHILHMMCIIHWASKETYNFLEWCPLKFYRIKMNEFLD